MYMAGSRKHLFEVALVWFSWAGRSGASFLAGQVFLLELNLQYKYSCLATSELAETSFFDRSSCWLEFSWWMNVEGGGGDPAEANPVVTIGKLGEDPSSSLKGSAL